MVGRVLEQRTYAVRGADVVGEGRVEGLPYVVVTVADPPEGMAGDGELVAVMHAVGVGGQKWGGATALPSESFARHADGLMRFFAASAAMNLRAMEDKA